MISVRLPSGEHISVDTDDPKTAASAGRAYLKSTRPAGYTDRYGRDAALMQGISLGFGDELVGAAAGAGRAITEAAKSPSNIGQALQSGYSAGYRESVDRQRAALAQYRRERPIAAGVAEFVPSLLGGGAISGALKKLGVKGIANAGASGAVSSAAYGAGSGVSPSDRLDQASEGAFVGGIAGAGIGAAGRLVSQTGAGLAGLASRFGATTDDRALQFIRDFSEKSPITPEELVSKSKKLPAQGGAVEEQLFELLGPGGLRLARGAAAISGPSEKIAREALTNRSERSLGHIVTAASKATGVGRRGGTAKIEDFLADLQARRAAESGPAYRAAYAEPLDQDLFKRDLYPLISGSDTSNEALGYAIKLADADQLRAIAALNDARRTGGNLIEAQIALEGAQSAKTALAALRAGQDIPETSVRALDYYQRGLAALAEKNANVPTLASAFEGAHDDFVRTLKQEAPKFAAAFDKYGNSKAQERYVELGRRVFSTDEIELAQQLSGVSGQNREAFLVGVMRAIHEGVSRNDTSFVRRLTRDKLLRTTLTDALGGPKQAKSFFSRIARTAEQNANQNFVLSGSRTAPLADDIRQLTDGESELGTLGKIIESGGRVDGVMLEAAANAFNRKFRLGLTNEKINEAVGRRIFRPATVANATELADELRQNPLLRVQADIARRRRYGDRLVDQAAAGTAIGVRERRNDAR